MFLFHGMMKILLILTFLTCCYHKPCPEGRSSSVLVCCVCVCVCVCFEDADLSCYGYRKPDWRQSALSRVQPLDCFCDIFFITSWENNLCKLQWCTEADHFTDYFGNEVHSVRQGISVIFSFINYWYYSPQLEERTTRSSFFLSWLHLGLYVSASPT